MATDWLEAFPRTCKPFLDEVDDILQVPLSKMILEGPNSVLDKTENTQPAIMAVSIMVLRVLEQEFGFKTEEIVDVTLGHSLGEFAAIVAGGFVSYKDGLIITRKRAEAMSRCTEEALKAAGPGKEFGMMALVCEAERFADLIKTVHEFLAHAPGSRKSTDKDDSAEPAINQVLIANVNSKNQVVLSGDMDRIKELLVQLRQFGGHDPRAVRLRSDSPFHSPIMLPAKAVMQKLLEKTTINFPGRMPCVSNVSARPFSSEANFKDLLARQCVETVRWWDGVKYLDQEVGVRRWIGLGPGKVGRNLVGKEVGIRGADVVRGGGVWGVSKPSEVDDLLKGLEDTAQVPEDQI